MGALRGMTVRSHHRRAHALRTLMAYGAASLMAAGLAMPFVWMVATALKSPAELYATPPSWWPEVMQWGNFAEAWHAAPFGRFYVNSIVTGVAATALQVGFAALMAYAFAYLPMPGKPLLFGAILATMMIPEEMKLVPNYLTMRQLGWVDTYWALIVPPAAHAFPVFVLVQQFRMLPRELLESARIDGAGHLRCLLHIVVPMSRAVFAAVVLMAFLGRWNDFLWPLVVTNRTAMRTLPIGLAYLKESVEGGTQWHILMAGTILVIIPLLTLYVLAQRHFVEGVTQGALKG